MTRGAVWTGLVLWSGVWWGVAWGPVEMVAHGVAAEAEKAPPQNSAPEKKAASPVQPSPKWTAGEEAIHDVLTKKTSLDFVDTPLTDVLMYFQDFHKIPFQLDHKALDDAGIKTDKAITTTLRGVSLGAALDLVLNDLNLTYTIKSEVLLVTTPEAEQNCLTTKVYPVSDLVVAEDEKGAAWDDFDSLIHVVTTTIQPPTWEEVGGPGSIAATTVGKARVLAISQTYRVHKEIARLFQDLRDAAQKAPADAKIPARPRPDPAHQPDQRMFGNPGPLAPGQNEPPTPAPGKSP